jgi:hypothetical protein
MGVGERRQAPEWSRLRVAIEALLDEATRDIRAYPPPIPACDAQFNHLLELRQGLPGELARLDALARAGGGNVLDFIESSPFCADLARRLAD